MSDLEQHFHETWLGMVQPSEGLVVSVPVLVQAQCMERQAVDAQRRLRACTKEGADGAPRLNDTRRVLSELLGYPAEALVIDGLKRHALFVPEGRQVLGCTTVLRDPTKEIDLVLVWELPDNTDFDRPETVTGPWSYPATAKLDRLLRHTGIPIGLLANQRAFRLVYAPMGEASGHLTFQLDDMYPSGHARRRHRHSGRVTTCAWKSARRGQGVTSGGNGSSAGRKAA